MFKIFVEADDNYDLIFTCFACEKDVSVKRLEWVTFLDNSHKPLCVSCAPFIKKLDILQERYLDDCEYTLKVVGLCD